MNTVYTQVLYVVNILYALQSIVNIIELNIHAKSKSQQFANIFVYYASYPIRLYRVIKLYKINDNTLKFMYIINDRQI